MSKGIILQSFGEYFEFPGEWTTPLSVYRNFYNLSDKETLKRLHDGRIDCQPEDFKRLVKLIKLNIKKRREKIQKFKEANAQLQGQLF